MLSKVALVAAMVAAPLIGCSSKKELIATGGSRADGTVTLSYEYGAFEKPQLSMDQGVATATQRCNAWGYPGAEPFGGEQRQCQIASQYGCSRWFVSMTFQCTGKQRT